MNFRNFQISKITNSFKNKETPTRSRYEFRRFQPHDVECDSYVTHSKLDWSNWNMNQQKIHPKYFKSHWFHLFIYFLFQSEKRWPWICQRFLISLTSFRRNSHEYFCDLLFESQFEEEKMHSKVYRFVLFYFLFRNAFLCYHKSW